jgi:periplasmic protein TonB
MSDIDLPRRLSRPIWLMAGLGAVALHAGGVALAVSSMQPDNAVSLGAPAIEIGVELLSPHPDPTELPVGPDSTATAAVPAIVEQKTVVRQDELPQAVPTETDDPDRAVTPHEAKKPKEEDPKIAAVQANPSTESAATEETATPGIVSAPQGLRSVAPGLGSGESAVRERQTWQKELAAHFNKYKRYPSDRDMQQAEVVVSFILDRAGHVLSAKIVKGSGDPSFDAAAMAMLARANPVPPPPPLVADEGLAFTLPVIFQVKGAEATAGEDRNPR